MATPTLGDKIIEALAQCGFNILDADKAKIEAALAVVDTNFANQIVTIVTNDFPRQSVEERMVEGPILALLKNAAPDIAAQLDAAGASLIATIETALTNAAKAS
jgi:hypothetical protein